MAFRFRGNLAAGKSRLILLACLAPKVRIRDALSCCREVVPMATSQELLTQIAGAKQTLEDRKQANIRLKEESSKAEERQKLRRQLEEVQKHISYQEPLSVRQSTFWNLQRILHFCIFKLAQLQESINNCECNYRRLVDADALGNTPSDGAKPLEVGKRLAGRARCACSTPLLLTPPRPSPLTS